MLSGDGVAPFNSLWNSMSLLHLAVQVVVSGVAVLVLVDATAPEGHLLQQVGLDQFVTCSRP